MLGLANDTAAKLRSRARAALPYVLTFLISAFVAAIIAAPVSLERAAERVKFTDRLGTFPVEVSLRHDDQSTLDTGLFGKVYWSQTGPFGFGAYARATGPPEAGGTLASYVDNDFIRANVSLIDDPDRVVDAYAAKFKDGLRDRFIVNELVAGVVGGAVLAAVLPYRRLRRQRPKRVAEVTVVLVVGATALSTVIAVRMFHDWSGNQDIAVQYAMPDVDGLSFSSPETLEVAKQVKPFIDKNTTRIEASSENYEATASTTFASQLALHQAGLVPREGEKIVLAEADTQGSFVGIDVRKDMYAQLFDAIGEEAFAVRTISGDVSSNGTVAESAYIDDESKVSGDVPTAAAGGDHDSEDTWKQMTDDGITVPDLGTAEVGGLRISAANDREHKTLFGGLVTNTSGISEEELGAQLRDKVDPDDSQIVLLHQPDAATGYLGLDSLVPVMDLEGSLTSPYDDGIPDQPPGIVNIGHRHVLDGPWVLWNTDGDEVTWTVVDQLGTAGGVENTPTFNRFSTPVSAPLRPLAVRLQYVNTESGLETGYATIECGLDGTCTISDRTEVGLPGGLPEPIEAQPIDQ